MMLFILIDLLTTIWLIGHSLGWPHVYPLSLFNWTSGKSRWAERAMDDTNVGDRTPRVSWIHIDTSRGWIHNTTLTFYDKWVKSKLDHWFIKEWTFGLSQNCYENVLETREELGKTTVDFTENFTEGWPEDNINTIVFSRFFPLNQRNDPFLSIRRQEPSECFHLCQLSKSGVLDGADD